MQPQLRLGRMMRIGISLYIILCSSYIYGDQGDCNKLNIILCMYVTTMIHCQAYPP